MADQQKLSCVDIDTLRCDPIPNEPYWMCEVVPTLKSSDVIQPLKKSLPTQANVGMYIKQAPDQIKPEFNESAFYINKLVNYDKCLRIPAPQSDNNQVTRMFYQFEKPGPHPYKELDRNPYYTRPYYYEPEYYEAIRQLHGSEYLKRASVCPAEMDPFVPDLMDVKSNWNANREGSEPTWMQPPSLIPKYTEEERRKLMFLVNDHYKAQAVQWYRKNYPTKVLPPIPMKFEL